MSEKILRAQVLRTMYHARADDKERSLDLLLLEIMKELWCVGRGTIVE